MEANYLREVTDALDGPACTTCGAIMVKLSVKDLDSGVPFWGCLSCGETKSIESGT